MLVIEAGYPPPQTQIPVYGAYGELVAVVDIGWEELKLALEYEGDHHRTNRRVFNNDIARHEALTRDLDWIVIRVTAEDTRGGILGRWRRPGHTERALRARKSPKCRPQSTFGAGDIGDQAVQRSETGGAVGVNTTGIDSRPTDEVRRPQRQRRTRRPAAGQATASAPATVINDNSSRAS